ncbi:MULTISPECIES: response regulator transcription factor [Shewanella]|jgi:two-component system response regulator DesR|uniref:response regulator transcription factor n=1 Tax=Shewanella TaxID=22 RepID=UPI00046A63D0|nr:MULTISPECIES: response regulator transcription factor [Shewanella]AXQ13857.1 DNA-binding response regulator [Shewanella algae]AYV15487.1 DNA-binding response regulator [Shewanella algae]EKT4488509.1 response regulator transcription factor [Shewanella algae]MBC8796622.1 response regulator transcription factor [Shewanella algae]MBO2549996.1 response regulator transcription factor [Shewanella algae]
MKILLAEDQAMVRGALAGLLQLSGDFSVTQATDGDQALALLKTEDFQLLLTDIEMPGTSGLELAAWVAREQPALKTIIITTFGRAGYIKRALEAGVCGFLLKDAPVEELVEAIAKVMQGKKVIAPELAMLALGEQDPLSDKERRALRLAAEGKSSGEIAAALFISEGTVRNYLSEAINKLGASNRIDAARIAKQKGWL